MPRDPASSVLRQTAPRVRRQRGARQTAVALERRRQALRASRALRAADPTLGELIASIGPHRPIITPDPFTALLCSIVQQQISMSAAAAVQRRLRALCPRRRFSAKAILALEDDDLRSAGLSRQKIRYARDLAHHFASGRLSAAQLRRMDDEQVIAATTQVYGIGRWTAEMLLIFCLERPDVWPIDDLGLRKAVGRFLGSTNGALPDAKTMRAAGERWRPYRTYASWYLWRSLEGPFMPGISL